VGSVTILKRGSEERLSTNGQEEIFVTKSHPLPPLKQDDMEIKETIGVKEDDYKQGELVLMWVKRKG